jgi:outer membrane protein
MKRLLTAIITLLPAWTAASADDGKAFRVRVGVGPQLQPAYVGADKEQVAPLFRFDLARDSHPFRFKGPDDAIGFGLISSKGFSVGPSVDIESRRKDADVGAAVGEVPRTIEAGAFVQYDDERSIRVRADIRQGIGGHKGLVGSVGADKYWRDGDRYVFSIGPRFSFSDARYQRAFFGVTPEASLATGLPIFSPRGGLHAVGMITGLTYQFSPRFGLFGYGRYDRLVGDAAKSPIVLQHGSRDQFSGGVGLTYTFSLRL